MRQATREYHFDWMLWSAFDTAAKLSRGSEKEYRATLKCIPYFRGIVEAMLQSGEAGQRFIELCARYFGNFVTARERGWKTAMTTFCFSPTILYALDIVPVCMEVLSAMMCLAYRRGTAEFLDYCNEVGFTETSCSSQRGALGGFLAGIGSEIDMVVTDTPGVCDTNANAFSFAAAYLQKPFFQLDFPPVLVDARTDSYQREDYKALIRFLEEHTGKRLDVDRLRQVLMEVEAQDVLIAELEDLTRLVPNPLPVSFGLLTYAGRFLFGGMPECTRLLEAMVEQARANAEKGVPGLKSGVEKVRAFFCYIDHYTQDLRLWQMLDELGIGYAGNILSRHWASTAPYVGALGKAEAAYNVDTTSLDTMLDSLAALNSRMPMVKQIRGPYDAPNMWLDDTLALAKLYSADCIIYNGTPGCRNTWGMVKLLARDTEKAGFPTHIINADAFDERVQSWQATRERFEEFMTVRRLLP
jgi:hypothetical protein